MSNVEIMEEKDEIHLPFAFEREENQSSMKIQNFQAEQDQPNWGQSLGNLRKWMGPMWYGYELSTPTQSDMQTVNIVGIGLINPTHRDYIGFVPTPHAHELKSLFTVNMCICSNKTSIQFYWLGGSKNHARHVIFLDNEDHNIVLISRH